MEITEIQTLIMSAISIGVFCGFIFGFLLAVFGKSNY